MGYVAQPVGNEISCVMYGIGSKLLNDHNRLEEILLEALRKDDFRFLGKLSHKFQPQGYTLVALIAESHVAIHTYPEYNSLFFYLYSCRGPGDGRRTFQYLRERLKPSSINLKERPVIVKSGHR